MNFIKKLRNLAALPMQPATLRRLPKHQLLFSPEKYAGWKSPEISVFIQVRFPIPGKKQPRFLNPSQARLFLKLIYKKKQEFSPLFIVCRKFPVIHAQLSVPVNSSRSTEPISERLQFTWRKTIHAVVVAANAVSSFAPDWLLL